MGLRWIQPTPGREATALDPIGTEIGFVYPVVRHWFARLTKHNRSLGRFRTEGAARAAIASAWLAQSNQQQMQ